MFYSVSMSGFHVLLFFCLRWGYAHCVHPVKQCSSCHPRLKAPVRLGYVTSSVGTLMSPWLLAVVVQRMAESQVSVLLLYCLFRTALAFLSVISSR
jgi:hypothetical protein